MTKTDIAMSFSHGEFDKTYDFIAENAKWHIVEQDKYVGKQSVIDNCKQVSGYFKTVTTDFKTLNVIADQDTVVINGTAAFVRNNMRIAFVYACDIYEFNKKGQIKLITSYCIPAKIS